MAWHVYILECADGRFYTGIAKDVRRRFDQHRKGRGARFTRCFGALRVLYSKKVGSCGDALKRERVIKRMPREAKLVLIASARPKRARAVKVRRKTIRKRS